MKKFPMLDSLLKLIIALTVGLLEKICILIYCLLPMGFFMLLMSLRTKNHKTTAISTFTNERSEFQHIFPNYILVIVEPSLLRKEFNERINKINNFFRKYTGFMIFEILLLIVLFIITYCIKLYF